MLVYTFIALYSRYTLFELKYSGIGVYQHFTYMVFTRSPSAQWFGVYLLFSGVLHTRQLCTNAGR